MNALELLKEIKSKIPAKTTSCAMYDFVLMERKVAFAVFQEGKSGYYKKFTVTVEEFDEPEEGEMITKGIIDLYNEIFTEN
ncbi:MAG: hypothetical protein WC333_01250 [Dehalococcoidia bacterium]|jgi:hypothetical protein